jgi:GxxExxY protein
MEMDRQDAKTPRFVGMETSDRVDRIAREIVDAAFSVHVALGPGYGELVYENAMCVELSLRGIRFARQPTIVVEYKGHRVGHSRLDLVVADLVVVELKAVDALGAVHTAQALAYLKATSLALALVINFNVARIKDGIRRIALTQKRDSPPMPT